MCRSVSSIDSSMNQRLCSLTGHHGPARTIRVLSQPAGSARSSVGHASMRNAAGKPNTRHASRTRRLRTYSRNLSTRVTAHPKLHVTDSGLATALSRLDENTIGRHPHFGHLLESFVVGEVLRQLGWSGGMCEPWYFRDAEGNEVDLVLERSDGSLVGVEVKAGVTVGPSDAKGLRRLRHLAGDRFVHGVVLYTGTGSFRIEGDPQLSAQPISVLWS